MFGKRLRELRKSKNLTMKELGGKMSLAESTISGYEIGNRKPDMEILQKLADFFEVSVDYLLGRTDKPTYDDNPINVSFRDGGENISEEEAEYLEQQLKQFRELRKKFQQEK